MPDLTLDAVSFRYPDADRDDLSEFSATIGAGRRTAIVGATGAGKSTLLQVMSGVIPRLTGGILRGRVSYGPADLADYKVATISQYIGLVLSDPASQLLARTVAADVAVGPRNHLVPRAEVLERVAEALRRVGLMGFDEREIAQLSGGERQRVAIAGVLAMAPEMLCLDEATAELDPVGTREVWQVLDGLAADAIGVVFAEHDPSAVIAHADEVIALAGGRIAWRGAPADLYRDAALVERLGLRPAPVAHFADGLLGLRPDLASRLPAGRLPVGIAEAHQWLDGLVPNGTTPPSPPSPADQPGELIIELRDVGFSYPSGGQALGEVSLQIRRQEFVAIVGPNGAGKSTLVKMLNGLLRPSQGTVRIDGRSIDQIPTWRLADEIGFCFQNPDHQLFSRTVADEVGYALRTRKVPADEIRVRVARALRTVGLSASAQAHPLTLDRSERQLVALASALVHDPAVLVVDEPTAGQDWAGIATIMDTLTRLNRDGMTIVMISHDPEVVAQHAKRVIEMGAGRIVSDRPIQLAASSELASLWHGWFGTATPAVLDEGLAARVLADLIPRTQR